MITIERNPEFRFTIIAEFYWMSKDGKILHDHQVHDARGLKEGMRHNLSDGTWSGYNRGPRYEWSNTEKRWIEQEDE